MDEVVGETVKSETVMDRARAITANGALCAAIDLSKVLGLLDDGLAACDRGDVTTAITALVHARDLVEGLLR